MKMIQLTPTYHVIYDYTGIPGQQTTNNGNSRITSNSSSTGSYQSSAPPPANKRTQYEYEPISDSDD